MSNRFVKVEDNEHLVKDKKTGAVININKSDTERVLHVRRKQQQEKKEIENLKREVSDIKGMLQTILEKL
jgi:hypothetical protein